MFKKGDIVVDIANNDRVGRIQDVVVDRVWLRRLGGGREWDVHMDYVRRATEEQILSARNADRNRMSRQGSY
jgi:hypothetical protein